MSPPSSMFALVLFFFASTIADVIYADPDGPYYTPNPSISSSVSPSTSQEDSAASALSTSSSWLSSLTTGAGWTYSGFLTPPADKPSTTSTSIVSSGYDTDVASLFSTIVPLQAPNATSASMSTPCTSNAASAADSMPSDASSSPGYFNNGTVSSVSNTAPTGRNVSTAVGPTPSTLSISFTGLASGLYGPKTVIVLAAACGLLLRSLM